MVISYLIKNIVQSTTTEKDNQTNCTYQKKSWWWTNNQKPRRMPTLKSIVEDTHTPQSANTQNVKTYKYLKKTKNW